MKNKSVILILLLLTAGFCSSCTGFRIKSKISGLERLVIKTSANQNEMDIEDWNKTDRKFTEYCDFFDRQNIRSRLTHEQKQEIALLKGKYIGYSLKAKSKQGINDVLDGIMESGKELEGILDALK